jgi:hypothetical protein
VRKEDYVQPWLRKMVKKNAFGVFFVFKSMEQGRTFRVTVPKFPTKDPNHRILARQKGRVDKDEARRIELGLFGFERSALGGNVRTILLGGVQRFF